MVDLEDDYKRRMRLKPLSCPKLLVNQIFAPRTKQNIQAHKQRVYDCKVVSQNGETEGGNVEFLTDNFYWFCQLGFFSVAVFWMARWQNVDLFGKKSWSRVLQCL